MFVETTTTDVRANFMKQRSHMQNNFKGPTQTVPVFRQSFQTIVSFVDAGGSMTSLTVRRELLSGQLITVAVLVMNFTLLSTIQLVTSLVLM